MRAYERAGNDYINKITGVDLKKDDKEIDIKNKESLKSFIDALNEKYYKTVINMGEKRDKWEEYKNVIFCEKTVDKSF